VEDTAGVWYVFMLLAFLWNLLTSFLGSQLRKRVAAMPKEGYAMNTAVCSMLVLLISFAFTVSPKKMLWSPIKKTRAIVAKNIIGQPKEEENDNQIT
jgi:hypothetical protein